MKKINLLILSLTLSLTALTGVAFEQTASANLPGPIECGLLTGCLSHNTCSGRGTPNGCTIACADGATVTCPKGGD